MVKVLVTGSSGFVGQHLVRALKRRGDEVISADKVTGQDLSDFGMARSMVAEHPDVIVHLASSCSTPGSLDRPYQTYTDTVMTAVNIIEAAREPCVPVILTSSVKARDGLTPYGAAKRMVETWALECRAAFQLPVVINRPGTIYGPGQEGSPESGWIAWFCKAKREGLPVIINGDGKQVRDLLHVSDYVRLLVTQLDDIETYDTGHVYDVGGGLDNAVSVLSIVGHLGLEYTLGPRRYGDSDCYIGHNDVPNWDPAVFWADSEVLRD
jgi:CDP-paratose 2-epimerase